MEFLAAFYRQQGESVSLLLQQYQYRQVSFAFAFLCEDREKEGRAGAYTAERCLGWFRGLNLKRISGNREKYIDLLSEELDRTVMEAGQELKEGGLEGEKQTEFAAVFCMEDIYIMLCRGTPYIYVINTAFGKACIHRLEGNGKPQGMYGIQGKLEPDIGILLATEGFVGSLTENRIKEGLYAREIAGERQLERRLAEFGQESQRLGGNGIGAVMLITKE